MKNLKKYSCIAQNSMHQQDSSLMPIFPSGISWAYFVNLKQGTGIDESYISGTDYYGMQIIGMLNSEYSENSRVELHDVGKSIASVQ